MQTKLMAATALIAVGLLAERAQAATTTINFVGPNVGGAITLIYGPATDAKYSNAFVVTGITGTFTDTNLGIVGTPILGLQPLNIEPPEPTNLLAPANFSRYGGGVLTGLGPENNGYLSYDNLFWPGGSPQTASDYPFSGGIFDIYGLMFRIGGGLVVNFWSNGDFGGGPDYGIGVASATAALDYTAGVVLVPEPGTIGLLGAGLLGLWGWRRRAD